MRSYLPDLSRPRVGQRRAPSASAPALAALLLAIALAPGVSAGSSWYPDPLSWGNGIVLCQFAAGQPAVNVSAFGLVGTGLTTWLTGMEELHPNGTVAAVANFSAAEWTQANLSGEDAYDLAYSTEVSIVSPSAPAVVLGSVELRVDFVLPAYAGSPAGDPAWVWVNLSVANWTWQESGDHLETLFSASPTNPASEHLHRSSLAGWLLASTSNATGKDLEEMGFGPNATAQPVAGAPVPVSATPALTLSSSLATVAVTFGANAGSFRTLAFTAQVAVVLPGAIAGVPLSEIIAVGAAAAVASLVLALFVRRVRARPSALIFADEERG